MNVKIRAVDVNIHYGPQQAIHGVSLDVLQGEVMAFIGPSGCGKSTLLRAFNRMNDTVPSARLTGRVEIDGRNIYADDVDVSELRRRVGLVFQKSNPFPMSIFDNVAYGLRIGGLRNKSELSDRVQNALVSAALWDEVADRLDSPASGLSGGQQQRMCIARALAVEPEVLLMDEPASALDPIATAHIEDLIKTLRGTYTVVIVTHNMQQAKRVSDRTAFFYLGKLVEIGPTQQIFESPQKERTTAYVSGKFG